MHENLIKDFIEKGVIEFKTGGTTETQKVIEKTFENMYSESKELVRELQLGEDLTFITTTTPEHLFGFTFFVMLPYVGGYKTIEKRVSYPEDINIENAVLITTPSFLDVMRKYNNNPLVKPKIIITAGAKLEDDVFKYALSISERVIEIYGSTETGIIGYRTDYKQKQLKIFSGINILETTDSYTKIDTQYSKQTPVIIEDRIKVENGKIEFLGRAGRVLKIQEKRVMSDEIEAAVKNLAEINDVYCFEHDGKLSALAVLSKYGQEFIMQNDKLVLTKILKQKLKKDFEIVPQRWRFIDEIPKKETGKIDKEMIEKLFCTNISLPLVLQREVSSNSAKFKLCFINNSNFFKGHFEGFPILAGVVQLFYANFFAELVFSKDFRDGQIRKIKYSNIIRPSQIVELELLKSDKGVGFKYYDDEKVYSSGILPAENPLQ